MLGRKAMGCSITVSGLVTRVFNEAAGVTLNDKETRAGGRGFLLVQESC